MPNPPTVIAARERTGETLAGHGGAPLVLIAVGDPTAAEPLPTLLRLAGYRTTTARTGAEALAWVRECRFDLVILDVLLPDVDQLRRTRSLVAPDRPAVLLLAEGEPLGTIPAGDRGPGEGSSARAPRREAEVLARARQLVGRARRYDDPARGGEPSTLRYDDLVLDESRCRALRGQRAIALTPAEYRLLRCLLLNPERVLSKEQIGRHVWDERPTDGAIERLVSRLRRKVNDGEPALIHTRRGFGYWLGRSTPG
ncbi:DNA-binding response regulator [Streptomyces spinoverrucosus]|uniref:DNA-binding response regulator n=1 Tax=Streptomyces spinoverrucosus TaxID=284043 RepID=A0A4Y3VEV3_9ACTN|nr:response regulator transcription factor [Streptomyces spinoverrucosus]GEC05414.1 DNA-binding response regulator [Streptomyces spinoverrucosus]GHB78597.1 DNA-binding response regulator [Streptomyces spinoverrucosus]